MNCPQPPVESRRPPGAGWRRYWFAWFAVTSLGIFWPEAQASNGVNNVVPMDRNGQPTFSAQSGLQIGIDTIWAGNRGYRPVKITATVAKPAVADTLVTINFHAGGWRNNHQAISVEYEFELAQGLTSTTATFAVPQHTDWNTCGWEIWVDGSRDGELCSTIGYNSGTSGALAAGILMPDLGQVNLQKWLSEVSSAALEWQAIDSTNLPARWIDYSPLDLLVASVKSLEFARVNAPDKFAELLRWIRAGGNLWVPGVGQDFSQLPDLNQLLEPLQGDESRGETSPRNDWRFLKLNGSGRARLNDLVTLSMQNPAGENTLSPAEILDSLGPNRAVDSRHWFVARAYGLGTIAALQVSGAGGRSADNVGTAAALERCSLAENLPWATRHGNDPAIGNPNFNNLLIPDVGIAPVFEFQLLISLFVIAIGPVNYWLLKRRNQLPLLLITVPVAALAATLLLFTYGFLADGIGVRVRARSLTLLDQQAGESASWARLSYYAGVAPSQGIEFPVDTVVYPILPSRSHSNSFGRRSTNQLRAVEWNTGQRQQQQQQLTRGWLASRTPTQYLTLTARPTEKHLDFDEEFGQLTATNRLGTRVLALLAQDHQGNIYAGELIDRDQSAKLIPATYVQAASKLRRLLTENLPQLPDGYMDGKTSRRGDYGTPLSDSLLELQLEAIVSPVATGWGKGVYLAVTATGIELRLGIEDATETNSFHVLRGSW